MSVEVVDRSGSGLPPGPVAELVEAVLAAEGVAGTVVVAFVDEKEMIELNGRYRHLAEPTDVLSFRYADDLEDWQETPTDRPVPDGDLHAVGSRGADNVADIGEVVVCLSVVRRYAEEEGGDSDRQLAWTLAHGVLHLVGYDHENDRGEMREREQGLLGRLGRLVTAVSSTPLR